MSDSLIPLASPTHVRLTQAGKTYWESWGSLTIIDPLQVFEVKGDDRAVGDPDYLIFNLATNQGLWVSKGECIAVVPNAHGGWEEVK